MNDRALQEQIGLLLATLAQTSTVDGDERDLLIALQRETLRLTQVDVPIESVLANDRSITDRLEALAVKFEADHPAIGNAIRQTVDALVKAGI